MVLVAITLSCCRSKFKKTMCVVNYPNAAMCTAGTEDLCIGDDGWVVLYADTLHHFHSLHQEHSAAWGLCSMTV